MPATAPLDPAPDALLDRLRRYAAAASTAPSKHNSQPWRFRIDGGALQLLADRSRLLSATDPDGRELLVSCGAAVHAAVVAAAALGVRLEVARLPEGPEGPVAVLREGPALTPTELNRARSAALLSRHTDRGPLDAGALPLSLPFDVQDAASRHGCVLRLVRTEGERSTFAQVLDLADRQLVRRAEVVAEVGSWTRSPEQADPDGVPAGATRGAGAASAAFPQRDFSLPGVAAQHDRPGVDAPLVGVLCTPADRPPDWIVAGEALMDVLLTVTLAGGSASYLNQAIEQRHTRDLLRGELALPGAPQVVLRLGAGGPVAATPRRALQDLLEPPSAL